MRANPTAVKVMAGESDSAPERSHVRQSWRKILKVGVGEWTCFQIIKGQGSRKTILNLLVEWIWRL